MAGSIKKFLKANNFPWVTFKNYWKNSSRSELITDVFLPFLISSLLIWWTSFYISDFKDLISKFRDLSGQVIAAISILAGFNLTSITVISAIGDNVKKLRSHLDSNGKPVYDVLVTFFTWAVSIQLIVVLLSISLYYAGSFIPTDLKMAVPIWGWICAVVWLSITAHSILISIRNLKTLFLYVTYDPDR
ncbi:hypothetical protein OIN60_08855 [Paenibacillus sp. P96]|uniref:Uncharacterized protein n=1 Tax=Paenibacillus zeirhizosphaerae TaxID=2987519 RepID=A0ABT9FQD6_9BACL|nr:hypothetical protein [Paenibacillus sp. P96]MDP4096879.1 hypothetical protein [Paenibacillus sp. P96]